MNKENYSSDAKSAFNFLVSDFGFKITKDEYVQFGHIIEYQTVELKIHLYFEYRDSFFYFYIVRGKNTKFPNDDDNINIKTFYDLIEKYQLGIEYNDLQPNENQYINALNLNAYILKKNGNKILLCEDWF